MRRFAPFAVFVAGFTAALLTAAAFVERPAAAGPHPAARSGPSDPVDALMQRFDDAANVTEARIILRALGDSGDRRILPVLTKAFDAGVPALAEAATYAYRLLPGADVDQALAFLLEGHPNAQVRHQALRAIAVRDADRWAPVLARTLSLAEKTDPALAGAIATVLDDWAAPAI